MRRRAPFGRGPCSRAQPVGGLDPHCGHGERARHQAFRERHAREAHPCGRGSSCPVPCGCSGRPSGSRAAPQGSSGCPSPFSTWASTWRSSCRFSLTCCATSRQFPSARLQLENISSSGVELVLPAFAHDDGGHLLLEARPRVRGASHRTRARAVAVSKKHPLAAVERPSIEALQGVRQIVVNARDSESESPITVSPDVWEVDGAQWAIGLAARGVGWTIVPRAVAMTQPGLRSSLALLSAPSTCRPSASSCAPRRTRSRPSSRSGGPPPLRKTARRLGLVQPESM